MAWTRKLPSGLWAATVRLPGDRKLTKSFPLKGGADAWAAEQEAGLRHGDWIDPREGEVTVGIWHERCKDSRHLEKASAARDESHWRRHVAPRWERVPIGSILKPDVSAWVVKMQRAGVGAATIEAAVGVLRGDLEQAVDARRIPANPARGVRMPRRDAHVDRILQRDEDDQLLDALDRHSPGNPAARLMCEVMLDTGVRWEEVAGLDRMHVDMRRHVLHIGPVMERDGTVRPYPKSRAGVRDVPIGDELWPRLREHVLTVEPQALVFTAPAGGSLLYPTWRARVWVPAIRGVEARGGTQGHPARTALAGAGLDDPQPTPHDLRHTFGTRLADNKVPPHEIMAIMGHSGLTSTQRYLHAGEDRFDRAREALVEAKKPRRLTSGS